MNKTIAMILTLVAAAAAQGQTPDAIITRAADEYARLQSVRAEFTQKLTNPLTGSTALSRGVLLRRAPNLLAVNFTDPKGDRVVADGRFVWVYLPSSAPNQVIRMGAKSSNSMAMIDPGEIFLSSPSTRYTVTAAGTATVEGRKMNIVSLVPKKANNAFTSAKVWVDASDNSVRQFELVDLNGLTRLVTITKLQKNSPIEKSAFKFTPPKNARVLDSGGLSGM
ncbi:MAG TPA: outer membrane lipoprotein carrier protein LolA [Gemmatimonadaceae bacterium]|nr:outer membrane lipoprotein carrier protein LolA [Gemmatimonadaceae bacterium]